jgi:hypothetical protein
VAIAQQKAIGAAATPELKRFVERLVARVKKIKDGKLDRAITTC